MACLKCQHDLATSFPELISTAYAVKQIPLNSKVQNQRGIDRAGIVEGMKSAFCLFSVLAIHGEFSVSNKNKYNKIFNYMAVVVCNIFQICII